MTTQRDRATWPRHVTALTARRCWDNERLIGGGGGSSGDAASLRLITPSHRLTSADPLSRTRTYASVTSVSSHADRRQSAECLSRRASLPRSLLSTSMISSHLSAINYSTAHSYRFTVQTRKRFNRQTEAPQTYLITLSVWSYCLSGTVLPLVTRPPVIAVGLTFLQRLDLSVREWRPVPLQLALEAHAHLLVRVAILTGRFAAGRRTADTDCGQRLYCQHQSSRHSISMFASTGFLCVVITNQWIHYFPSAHYQTHMATRVLISIAVSVKQPPGDHHTNQYWHSDWRVV